MIMIGLTLQGSFQSAPGGEAGGNHRSTAFRRDSCGFNPPPAVRPGETRYVYQLWRDHQRFNPPPAVRPGETRSRRPRTE